MTMGHRVADAAMLKGLAVGDRVTFDARDDGGQLHNHRHREEQVSALDHLGDAALMTAGMI